MALGALASELSTASSRTVGSCDAAEPGAFLSARDQGQVVASSQKASVPTALAGACQRMGLRRKIPPSAKAIATSERTSPRCIHRKKSE